MNSLALGLIGISWDLPSSEKKSLLLPQEWQTPAFYQTLSQDWEEMHGTADKLSPLVSEHKGLYTPSLKGRLRLSPSQNLPAALRTPYRSMLIRSRFPDEANTFAPLSRMRPQKLDFRPISFIYGGAYLYPLGAYLKILSVARLLPLRSLADSILWPEDLAKLYVAARLAGVLSFTLCCLMAFLIGKALQGSETGVLAAWFVSLSPCFLVFSHCAMAQTWACFWSLAAIYGMVRASGEKPSWRRLAGIGACVGLSIGSHLGYVHVLLFLGAWLLFREGLRASTAAIASIVMAAAIFFYFTSNPYTLIRSQQLHEEVLQQAHQGFPLLRLKELWPFFSKTLVPCLGAGVAALSLWGAFTALRRPKNTEGWLAVAVVAGLILFPLWTGGYGAETTNITRRFLSLLVMGLVLGAFAFERMTRSIPKFLKAGTLLLVLGPSALLCWNHSVNFRRAARGPSTFTQMGTYLNEQKLLKKDVLGLLHLPQPFFCPPFRMNRWELLLVEPQTLSELSSKERPDLLLVTIRDREFVREILASDYRKVIGFEPYQVSEWFPFHWTLSYANTPIELYRKNG